MEAAHVSTHNAPWLEGDALQVFFKLGGRPAIGDEVVLDPENVNQLAGTWRQRRAARTAVICTVVALPEHPDSRILKIKTPHGKRSMNVLQRRLLKLRRTSCLTK